MSEFEVKLNWLIAHRRCFCPLATALVRYVFLCATTSIRCQVSGAYTVWKSEKGKVKVSEKHIEFFFPTTQFSNCEKECRSQQHSVDLRLDDLFTPHHQCCAVQQREAAGFDGGEEKSACLRT